MCSVRKPCKDGCSKCDIQKLKKVTLELSDTDFSLVDDTAIEIAEKKMKKLKKKVKKLKENRA